MGSRHFRGYLAIAGIVLFACPAAGQSAGDTLVELLYSREDVKPTSEVTGVGRGYGFGGPIDSEGVVTAFRQFINSQTSTFPTGSSSAGFSFTFDPQTGLHVNTRSFGPLFAERAVTGGKGRWGLTTNFQATKWKSLNGKDMDRAFFFRGLSPDGGGLLWQTELGVSTASLTFGATYGLTDRIDIGIVVPVNRTRVSGTSTIRDLTTDGLVRACGVARNLECRNSITGTSTGIGDVTGRFKWHFAEVGALQLAVSGDLRLPTGDADKLLGSGNASGKMGLIAAYEQDVVSVHGGMSFTKAGRGIRIAPGFGRGPTITAVAEDRQEIEVTRTVAADSEQVTAAIDVDLSDEVSYAVGMDAALHPRVTLAADLVGRVIFDSARFQDIIFNTETRLGRSTSVQPFLTRASLHLLLGIAGVKVALGSDWVVTANVLFPLNDEGLTPHITPVFGFERVIRFE